MPKPRVVSQPKSTQHFVLGINAMADLLAPTLGPIGGVVANQRDHQRKPELLDDSATAVRRILDMKDPRMDVGAMLMRSLVWRVVQRAGDGGATAAVLTRAIHAEAVRILAAGANAMQVAKGVNLAIEKTVEALQSLSRPVHHEDELAAVALTVVRDPDLAAVLGEMSYLLGPDAHVTIEKYVAQYLQQYYYPGASYKAQIASMYLYTQPTQRRAVLPAGHIAIIDGKLENVDDAVVLLETLKAVEGKALTIVAGSFSDEVIGLLVTNSSNGAQGSNKQNGKEDQAKKPIIVGARLKDVGDARRLAYDDLAMLTGAAVLGRAWSKPVGQLKPDDLGDVLRSEVTTDFLHVVPAQPNTAEVQEKIGEIRSQLSRMSLDDEDRPTLVKRLSALRGGTGILKIGAESKLDREVRAQNAERALKVLSAAQHGGVVPGGGSALFHCIPELANVEAQGDIRFGVQIVERALAAPLRQILENAHVPSSSVLMDKIRAYGPTGTYDVISGEIVDAFDAGVLDVTNVLSTVVRTAASSALMALTTDTIVYHKKPEQSMTP